MSKRRKGQHGRHRGGGRVTPKGTRPGGATPGPPPSQPAGPPPAGPSPSRPHPVGPLDDHDDGFLADPVLELVSDIEAADRTGDPLQVEMWAAGLVGNLSVALRPRLPWETPDPDEAWDGGDPPSEEEFFGTLVASLGERLDGPDRRGVLAALYALAAYLPPAAADDARSLIGRRPGAVPSWAGVVGSAVVEEAFLIDHETGDAHNVALVARYPATGARWMAMLFVDVNLGGMGKDILIADAIDEVRATADQEGLELSELSLPEARASIMAALEMTDMTIDAPVSDDFDETRPMLDSLLATMPPAAPRRDREPPDDAEVAELAERLAELGLGRAEPGVTREELVSAAQLMIDFTAFRMGCAPLAWSPARLEVFLVDHVPRKVAAPPEELSPLPDHLRALVPGAHELAGWGDRHLSDALEVIELAAPVFRQALAHPELGGPARQLMMRALAEGIDLEDPDELAQLVERVNALGGIDPFGAGADVEYIVPEPLDVSSLPAAQQDRVAEIDDVMMELAVELADPEHLELSRSLLVRLAEEHPDALARGGAAGWSGGIPYAVCQINKMIGNGWWSALDITGVDIAEFVELSQQTVSNRAKQVRELLELDEWPPPEPYFRSDVRARYDLLGRRVAEWQAQHGESLD